MDLNSTAFHSPHHYYLASFSPSFHQPPLMCLFLLPANTTPPLQLSMSGFKNLLRRQKQGCD